MENLYKLDLILSNVSLKENGVFSIVNMIEKRGNKLKRLVINLSHNNISIFFNIFIIFLETNGLFMILTAIQKLTNVKYLSLNV